MVEFVSGDFGLVFHRLDSLVVDQFHPVSIWIKNKSNILLSTIGQLLFETNPRRLQGITASVDVVDSKANVAKPSVRIGITIVDLEVRVGF